MRRIVSTICALVYLGAITLTIAHEPRIAAYREIAHLGNGTLTDAAWRWDGAVFALSGSRGVWLYTQAGHEIGLLEGEPIAHVAWSPRGDRLAGSGGLNNQTWDNTVYIWETGSKRLVQTLTAPDDHGQIRAIAWSPDGAQLASAGAQGVWVWDVATGQLAQTFQAATPVALAWRANGLLVTSTTKSQLWDVNRGQLKLEAGLKTTDPVSTMSWSPDDSQIALALSPGDEDLRSANALQIWDTASNQPRLVIQSGAVASLTWSPDGAFIATGAPHNLALPPALNIWDARQGRLVRALWGHTGSITAVRWRPDSQQLLSVAADNTARLWDIASLAGPSNVVSPSQVLHGFMDKVQALAWSPDGSRVASANADGGIRIWDGQTGQPLDTLPDTQGALAALAWSPDGQGLASAGAAEWVRWNLAEKTRLSSLKYGYGFVDYGTAFAIATVAWSPRGDQIATSGYDRTIVIWEANTNRVVRTLPGEPETANQFPIRSITWSPDGRQIAGAYGGAAWVWEVASGRRLASLACDGCRVFTVAWSPDGSQLAGSSAVGADGPPTSVWIWDAATFKLRKTLQGQTRETFAMAWRADGAHIAGAHGVSTDIWDVASGQIVATLATPPNTQALAWNPHDQRLATGGDSGIIIWSR
jgi:WD40 repeat protein